MVPFSVFFPPYLGGGTECFERAACGLVPARSCDTGVTSMGRRTDARLCLIGSAHFPSLEQNGEKKEGIWQTDLAFIISSLHCKYLFFNFLDVVEL